MSPTIGEIMAGAGPKPKPGSSGREFVFPASAKACAEVHTQVLEITLAAGFREEAQLELDLALQEALANALMHGCKNDPSKHIHCNVQMEDRTLVITITDPGSGFDPNAVPDPLSEVGQGRFSGRGVHFIRSVMDEVSYARNGSELTMRKRLPVGMG
jgi:serine/threonine-protein kinase RsbW